MLVQTTHDVQQALSSGKDPKTLDAKEIFKGYESFGRGFVTQERWLKFMTDEDGRAAGKAPAKKKSLAEPLYDALKAGGAEAVVAKYRELEATAPDDYDFNEYVLNAFGYHLLLNRNRPVDAIVILKANVEEYPAAFNPYDSLGEAYLAAGRRDLAIASYRKALEVNPDFQNAKAQIKKIEEMEAKGKQAGTRK
jgi:tetratricopeptide (TPR) repeat protein